MKHDEFKYLDEIEYRSIDDLEPNPRNTRTHSGKQIRQIANSIKEFGFTNPVLSDEENQVERLEPGDSHESASASRP